MANHSRPIVLGAVERADLVNGDDRHQEKQEIETSKSFLTIAND